MPSFLHFTARLLGYANAITKGRDEQGHEPTAATDTAWPQQMLDEIAAESRKTTMLEFPGFPPLWSFGTEYRDAESKWHYGPPGWYGIAHEFGGSYLPDGWYEIASEFGEKVHPSADTGSPNQCVGHHWVGPEPDPTSALLAMMRYVQALEAKRESEYLDAEKEAFGPSESR